MESDVNNNTDTDRLKNRVAREKLEHQMKAGLNWFYWIAALSLINIIIYYAGQGIRFVIGLGITHVIDGFVMNPPIAIVINVLLCGFIAFIGYIGRSIKFFIFLGILLYILDSILFLVVQDWLSVGFHAFALFFIIRGFLAKYRLEKYIEAEKQEIPESIDS